MLVLLLVSLGSALALGSFQHADLALRIATPIWVMPEFDWLAILNLALPLYLITMLSQNLPGIAMLKSYQYDAPIKPILVGTGLATLMSAPFGGFSVNLAAISAAICMNEDVDQDKAQRYRAVLWAGGFYLLAGFCGPCRQSLPRATQTYFSHARWFSAARYIDDVFAERV